MNLNVNVSELDPDEIAVSDQFITALAALWRLGPKRRRKLYHRWEMLHLFPSTLLEKFEANLCRINKKEHAGSTP